MVFGRVAGPNRRGFLRGAGLASMGAVLGTTMPFHANFPAGLIPAALAQSVEPFTIEGKHAGLIVHNDRPVNMETPPHLLDDDVTPADRHFVRNNGTMPDPIDRAAWRLTIDGEVEEELELSYEQLESEFEQVTLRLQIECGGNGRAGFNPLPRQPLDRRRHRQCRMDRRSPARHPAPCRAEAERGLHRAFQL